MDRHNYQVRAHEFARRGEQLPHAKLTAKSARRVRIEAQHGARLSAELRAVSLKEIARKMCIGERSLRQYIESGARTRSMCDETCRLIDAMLAERDRIMSERERYTRASIASRYGITPNAVDKVVNGYSWGHVA